MKLEFQLCKSIVASLSMRFLRGNFGLVCHFEQYRKSYKVMILCRTLYDSVNVSGACSDSSLEGDIWQSIF